MSIRFIGANPGLTILGGDERIAYASVWRTDWSERGAGRAIVLWHQGLTRVVATDAELGGWLAHEFTRHFPEVAGLPWPEPVVETGEVHLELDLAAGMTAVANDIRVELGEPTDRRLFTTDDFELGGVKHSLSTVFMPCSGGSLKVGSVPINGQVKGFIADAEVWWRK